ncbi:hypothetical protein NMY22_g1194 [Coprinellus aureogranulatus]|nr:hypothetical protein NMY22_g1194 [Coprinellus aureogranulatus]
MDSVSIASTQHCASLFTNHRAPINTVSFSGDDQYIYLYKLSTDKRGPGRGRLAQKLSPRQGQVTAIRWVHYPASTGTYFFVSAGANGTVILWKKGESQKNFESVAVKLVAFRLAIEDIDIYDHKLVVVGGAGVHAYTLALDATARFIPHVVDFQFKNAMPSDGYGTAMSVRFIRRGKTVLAGYVDGKILCGWNWTSGKQAILEALTNRPARIEYHEGSQILAVCNLANGVDLYSMADDLAKIGTIVMDIPADRIYHFDIRFGREGEIIIGGLHGKAHVYRLADRTLIKSLRHSNKPILVQAIAYYQCAEYALIATASSEDRQPGTVKVWSPRRNTNWAALLAMGVAAASLALIVVNLCSSWEAVELAVRQLIHVDFEPVVLSFWGKVIMAIVTFTQAAHFIQRRPLWQDAARSCNVFLKRVVVQLLGPIWELVLCAAQALAGIGLWILGVLGSAGRGVPLTRASWADELGYLSAISMISMETPNPSPTQLKITYPREQASPPPVFVDRMQPIPLFDRKFPIQGTPSLLSASPPPSIRSAVERPGSPSKLGTQAGAYTSTAPREDQPHAPVDIRVKHQTIRKAKRGYNVFKSTGDNPLVPPIDIIDNEAYNVGDILVHTHPGGIQYYVARSKGWTAAQKGVVHPSLPSYELAITKGTTTWIKSKSAQTYAYRTRVSGSGGR